MLNKYDLFLLKGGVYSVGTGSQAPEPGSGPAWWFRQEMTAWT